MTAGTPVRRHAAGLMGTWLVLVAILAAIAAPATSAATTWGTPTATATYGESIAFRQPANLDAAPRRVEILLELPGGSGPVVTEVQPPGGAGGVTLAHELRLSEGHLLPNTTVTARWRVTAKDGRVDVGPPVTVRYDDTRFQWKTLTGEVVRVHWYQGSDDFGRRALAIGDRAIRETAELLGVTSDQPVDFFVYADQDSFYEALGPGTRENVGGQANAEIRTLFALITPGEINDPWVGVVIPHELVHLVFDTAVENPYHFPPRWLNEGLAVYLSQGYDATDRGAVEAAARNGSLIPLDGLGGQFPTTADRFSLAYAESVSAVDSLIRTHGRDALVALIRSYAKGLTDDEVFQQAIGVDVTAFDAAWRAQLKAKEPVVYGPQSPPPGPLPAGWMDAEGSAAPTLEPGAPAPTTGPAAPAPAGSSGPAGVLVAIAGAVIAVGLVLFAMNRRRTRTGPAA